MALLAVAETGWFVSSPAAESRTTFPLLEVMSPFVVRAPLVPRIFCWIVVMETLPWAVTSSVSPESPMVVAPPACTVIVEPLAVALITPVEAKVQCPC